MGGDRPSQTAQLKLFPARIHGTGLELKHTQGGISTTAPRWLAPPPHSLPPILHKTCQVTVSACSKGSWGLSVLLRVRGIFTTATISPGRWLRQCSSRYAIHAGRNLPDKELRYLRTVIVTAAVYRGFGRELAPASLTYRHRAGVSLYTSTYVLAETCVFDKQSQEPIFCGLQQREPPRAPLIANLRGHFAEFLNQCSPERLRLLVSPTCVSFSTVAKASTLRGFSWTSCG